MSSRLINTTIKLKGIMKHMKTLRVLSRVLIIEDQKILLARNKNADFWYPPGGGWEYETETIKECAKREVMEETGYSVDIKDLLWLQEFHESGKIFFETFWRAYVSDDNKQTIETINDHIDLDPRGAVEEVRWFTAAELEGLKVFPKRVKHFDDIPANVTQDPFIGTFL